tara:strand:- start:170 stop:412 length:243 start_codon:yes stop_codon:yes gene_type:complete
VVVAVVLDNPIVISHQPVVLVVEMVGIILVIPLLQQELQGKDFQVVLDLLIIILVVAVELVMPEKMVNRAVEVVEVVTEK